MRRSAQDFKSRASACFATPAFLRPEELSESTGSASSTLPPGAVLPGGERQGLGPVGQRVDPERRNDPTGMQASRDHASPPFPRR